MNDRNRQTLIDDARAATNVEVREFKASDSVRITRWKPDRRCRSGRKYVTGVDLWEDGTATRCDVRADLALSIRSADQVREILGL